MLTASGLLRGHEGAAVTARPGTEPVVSCGLRRGHWYREAPGAGP